MSIKVMDKVWSDSGQKGSALLLLLAIADHAADDGYCWPNTETLAKKIRMSVRTVYRLVDAIEQDGELYVVRANRNNRYVVTLGMTRENLIAVLKARKEDAEIRDKLSPIEKQGDKMTRDIAMSLTGDTCVTSQVTQLCHPNRHEPSFNRQKNDAPASVPVGDPDLDDIDWHAGKEKIPDNGGVKRFQQTGDMVVDIVAASDLSKQRGIPDWGMQAEGVHPLFPVVKTFCEMTRQDVGTLRDKEAVSWLKAFAKLVRDKGVTPGELVEAHRILPQEQWGDWYLNNHKWSSPYVDSYADMVVLAARQIRDGTLEPENAWSGKL